MRQALLRTFFLCTLLIAHAAHAGAQSPPASLPPESEGTSAAPPSTVQSARTGGDKMRGNLFGLDEVQRQLREQGAEIERLRAMLEQQTKLMNELRARVEHAEIAATSQLSSPVASVRNVSYAPGAASVPDDSAQNSPAQTTAKPQANDVDARLTRVEEASKKTAEALGKQLGSITFSGDIRLRYESFYGQQNSLADSGNSSVLGNPLSTRQRQRLRLRFGVRGTIGKEFEWGLRLATGAYPDVISSNQTLTDFFSRKPFALDQAYITYKPTALPGFQIQGGKFDAPWTRTELTFDNDINPEGLNESYTRAFKNSAVKSLAFVAWQLPFLERNSAFVLNANGGVNLDASARGGRDLALYGAQLRTRIEPSKHAALTLSAADLFYSGTQFITPAQVFGPNILFPVTFTIPATATTPAQTVTTQVAIPRDLLVAGNANLGLSTATNNAVNRDGRLASGYNLLDLIARLDLSRSKHWPVMMLLNFVHNTQAHDVLSTDSRGANFTQPNNENNGYWAEFQIGKDVLRLAPKDVSRGDFVFNYTFMRIEKDAVLTPFNASDIGQQSDVRVNRFIFAYALDPRVSLALNAFFTHRTNGLLGAFGNTPPGSLNRTLTRFQFDTLLRF